MLARLVGDLDAQHVPHEVVVDPDPFGPTNPWRTARKAWAAVADDATHHVVLQDDAIICNEFSEALELVADAQPTAIVALFVNWLGHIHAKAQLAACEATRSFARLPRYGWYPTVATMMPAALARDFGDFQTHKDRQIADDAQLALWANPRGHHVLVTVPSLVEHDETALSTIAGHNRPDTRPRSAACFIGDTSPLDIDWTRGPR